MPPGAKITSDNFKNYFSSLVQQCIAVGDFNSKHHIWGNRSANTRGRKLNYVLTLKNYSSIPPPGPNYWHSHSNRLPDILDLFITKIPNHLNTNMKNLDYISSDHIPIHLELGALPVKLTRPSLTHGRLNWPTFRNLISSKISLQPSLKTTLEMNKAIQLLTISIQGATLAVTEHDPIQLITGMPLLALNT